MQQDASAPRIDSHATLEESDCPQKVMRAQTPDTFAILLLDIDHFGQYNDTYGHPAGNELLKAVADILQTSTRDSDIQARLERDIFAVLLPETPLQGSVIVAERLRAAVAAYQGKQPISVSIGIASKKIVTIHESQVMDEAEQALALSKKLGRNCAIHFDLSRAVIIQADSPAPVGV